MLDFLEQLEYRSSGSLGASRGRIQRLGGLNGKSNWAGNSGLSLWAACDSFPALLKTGWSFHRGHYEKDDCKACSIHDKLGVENSMPTFLAPLFSTIG